MSHVSALRSADTGARNKPRSWEVPVQANTQDTPETASLRIDLWEAWLKKKLFGLAKAGRGSGLKKKLKVELNPCPKAIFFALIHPLLKHGRTLQCQNTSGCKHRTLVESDWGVLEDFCDFEQHGGWRSCCINSGKGETFYNVIVQVTFKWTERTGRNEELLVVEATVVSLNPLATIALPPAKTSKRIKEAPADANGLAANGLAVGAITNYVRGFPARLNKDGYSVDKRLRRVCKQHAKQQLLGLQQPSGVCFICNPSHHPSHNWYCWLIAAAAPSSSS